MAPDARTPSMVAPVVSSPLPEEAAEVNLFKRDRDFVLLMLGGGGRMQSPMPEPTRFVRKSKSAAHRRVRWQDDEPAPPGTVEEEGSGDAIRVLLDMFGLSWSDPCLPASPAVGEKRKHADVEEGECSGSSQDAVPATQPLEA